MDWLQEEWAGTNADKHVTSPPDILRKSRRYLIRKVGNHRSFLTFITSGTPTLFLNLIWSKHKRCFFENNTKTMKHTTAQVMIRLSGLQWRSGTQHRKCMHEIAARTKPWTVGTNSQNDDEPPHHKMAPQQRQVHFRNQWNVVQTTAGGSNTKPTRPHPELGQAHRAPMIINRGSEWPLAKQEGPLRKHSDVERFFTPPNVIKNLEIWAKENNTICFICLQLHDRQILLRCHFFSCCCLPEIEDFGWKQSNPGCAEKHIIAAAHLSQNLIHSTDTDGTFLYTSSILTTVIDIVCLSTFFARVKWLRLVILPTHAVLQHVDRQTTTREDKSWNCWINQHDQCSWCLPYTQNRVNKLTRSNTHFGHPWHRARTHMEALV